MKKLIAHGFTSLEKIVATPEGVTDVPGVGEKTAEKIVAQARAYLEAASDDSAPTAGDGKSDAVVADPAVERDEEVLAMSVADGAGGVSDVEPGPDLSGLDEASGGER
jgi:Holliday junction resolvasome RuvABC DNA-binding subunit